MRKSKAPTTAQDKPRTGLGRSLRTASLIGDLLGGLVYLAFAAFYVLSYTQGMGNTAVNLALAALNVISFIVHIASHGFKRRQAKEMRKSMSWWKKTLKNILNLAVEAISLITLLQLQVESITILYALQIALLPFTVFLWFAKLLSLIFRISIKVVGGVFRRK